MSEAIRQLVDPETSEIIPVVEASAANKIVNNTDQPVTVTITIDANQQLSYRAKPVNQKSKRRLKWEFSMLNIDSLYEYISKIGLSDNEMAFILFAMVFVDYNCVLCSRETGQYLTTSDLPKLLRWSKSKVIEVVNSLELRDMLVRFNDGRRKCVMMNPELLYRGKFENIEQMIKRYNDCKSNKKG